MPKRVLSTSAENRVEVFVWFPSPTSGAVGHTALKTEKHYISFWPTEHAIHFDKAGKSHFNWKYAGVDGAYPQYADDRRLETDKTSQENLDAATQQTVDNFRAAGVELDPELEAKIRPGVGVTINRNPDVHVALYSLNVAAINAEYERIKRLKGSKVTAIRWSMFGGSVFRKSNTFNCSGLVSHLLYKGGIQKVLQSKAHEALVVGAGVLAVLGLLLGYKEGDGYIPTSIFGMFLGSWLGATLGGMIGGIADGRQDANNLVNTLRAATNTPKLWACPLRILGGVIGGMSGTALGFSGGLATSFDRGMLSVATVPTHVAVLAQEAKKYETQWYEYDTTAGIEYLAEDALCDAELARLLA